ncbi:MAG TPA: DUF6544 family protein [Desulfobacteria bacterium]|nr:DUF6544 family protein [Desulfobacteria bacterium]
MWKKIGISLVVVIFIITLAVSSGDYMLTKQVSKEIEALFANSDDISDTVFTYEQISNLPEPVQRYFKYSLKEGQPYISYARLKHDGFFRTAENQKWLPITGEEYFTTQPPGFVWVGTVKPFPVVWITARDTYFQGTGNNLIKLFSIITIGDARGKEIDQGTLARWLAEAAWYPTALLPGERLQWEAIDSNSARLVFSDAGITISATVDFNENGEIVRLDTDRYRDSSLEKWSGYYREYKEIDGVTIPTEAEVVWHLESGDFRYARFRVTEIEFNQPSRYE